MIVEDLGGLRVLRFPTLRRTGITCAVSTVPLDVRKADDRARLAGMTELEREEILADRREEARDHPRRLDDEATAIRAKIPVPDPAERIEAGIFGIDDGGDHGAGVGGASPSATTASATVRESWSRIASKRFTAA